MEVQTIMETKNYFPKTSILETGDTAPEGTIIKTCESCKKNFAVTSDYADATMCESCAEAIAKANAVADMKNKTDDLFGIPAGVTPVSLADKMRPELINIK